MAKKNLNKLGILIGCRDVVFAKMTADASSGTTYETDIYSAPGVIEIGLMAQVTNESLGADDVPLYEVLNSLDGFDVNVNMASLGNDGKAFVLGNTIDDNGVLVEASDDEAPYLAMGFKTARSDGSDDYVWLYKGKFAQSDATFHTKEKGTVNWQTPTLTGTFMPRISDKRIRATVNTNDEDAASVLATFFDTVYTPDTTVSNDTTGDDDGE